MFPGAAEAAVTALVAPRLEADNTGGEPDRAFQSLSDGTGVTNAAQVRSSLDFAPDLPRNLNAAGQFRPLLVLGQGVAFFGRSEAALR
jgi:hypothetical protein